MSKPDDAADDAVEFFETGDHVEMARAVLATREVKFAEGAFYSYDTARGVWDSDGELARMHGVVHAMSGKPVAGGAQGKASRLKIRAGDVTGTMTIAEQIAGDEHFFDSPAVGLACANGFVRVGDNGVITVAAHDPEHRARAYYPLTFDPDAQSPAWEAFLRDLFIEDADAEDKIACLGEFFGASLFGLAPRFQRCIIAPGSGANGKSTLLDTVGALFPLGSVRAFPPQSWEHDAKRAEFVGALLNMTAELPSVGVLASELFKAIVTSDLITAERKYERPFSFRPVAGHIFACNALPATNDQTHGFWRRFIVIPFRRNFEGDPKIDKTIKERLLATERAAILAWLVRGASRLVANKVYTVPASHSTALEAWRQNSDSVRLFIAECTTRLEGQKTQASRAYSQYRQWAIASGYKPVAQNKFGERLAELKIDKTATNAGNFYALRLLPPEAEPAGGRYAGAATAPATRNAAGN